MEEERREESQRVTVEAKHGDDRTHTVLFAAGTALLMAWLKRAVMVCLVEQWRAWVFLTLNLVLLAIVFTSARSSTTTNTNESKETSESSDNKNDNAETEVERKRRKKQCRWSSAAEVGNEHKISKRRSNRVETQEIDEETEIGGWSKEEVNESRGLSKEELNERVEAFIAMFRQHLVSDARKASH